MAPGEMFVVPGEHLFPFLRTLGGDGSTYSHHMKDARFTIPTAALLARVVDMIDHVPMDDRVARGALDREQLSCDVRYQVEARPPRPVEIGDIGIRTRQREADNVPVRQVDDIGHHRVRRGAVHLDQRLAIQSHCRVRPMDEVASFVAILGEQLKPICPHCECPTVYECRRLSGALRLRCKACRKDFSVTSGTLFAFHKMPRRVPTSLPSRFSSSG